MSETLSIRLDSATKQRLTALARHSKRSKSFVTTPDHKFSLRTVACFGQCALAPVVEVDHAIYGHMNEQALHREVEALEREKGK